MSPEKKGNKSSARFDPQVLTLLGISLVLLGIATFTPWWLYTPPQYGERNGREYGLFTVKQNFVHDHINVRETACENAHKATLMDMPILVISDFHHAKCSAYAMFMYVSYGTGFTFCIMMMILGLAIVSSTRKNIHSSMMPAVLSLAVVLVGVFTMGLYIWIMDMGFQTINSTARYPIPAPSISFWAACLAMFFTFVSMIVSFSHGKDVKEELVFEEVVRSERVALRMEVQQKIGQRKI